MKKGYHSTQTKAFNTIPRSIYLGIILGFGIGMVVSGLFRVERDYIPEIVFAVLGYVIGKWYDDKYCAEKDIPAEELEKQAAAEAAAKEALESGEPEDADTPEQPDESEESDAPEEEPAAPDKSDESDTPEPEETPEETEPATDN